MTEGRATAGQRRLPLERQIPLWFGVALAILVTVGALALRSTSATLESAEWVAHTLEVRATLGTTLARLIDAETGARGYVITGQRAFLEPYDSAQASLDGLMTRLRTLTVDNADQQRRLDSLQSLISEKMSLLRTSVAARRERGLVAAVRQVAAGEGKAIMDGARGLIASMDDEEAKLLSQRSAGLAGTARLARLSVWGGTLLALAVAVVASVVSGGQLAMRRRAEEATRTLNEDLERRVQQRTAELQRSNRALRMLSDCNQTLIRATDETQLVQAVCNLVVEKGGYQMCFMGFAEHDAAKTVRVVAWAGGEPEHRGLTWADAERGRGPTGVAIRTGQPAVFNDLTDHPDLRVWREAIRRQGLASAAALPLQGTAGPLGALVICSAEPNAFSPPELELLTELADDLAFGIAGLRTRAEHERAETALRESEERLRFALDGIGAGEWDLDLLDHTAHRSLQHDRIFGYATLLPLWTYEMFLEHVVSEDRELVGREFQQAVAEGRDWDFECRIARNDRQIRWIWASGRHYRDEHGNSRRLVGIVQDITARKQAAEEIRRLNAELEQRVIERTAELVAVNQELEAFSYSVSHDLRAPLRSIDGFSQALLEDCAAQLDERGKGYLQRVRAATRRLAELIDDLLGLSRVTRAELKRERVDLVSLARSIAAELREREPERVVDFVYPEGAVVEGDARLLRVVLENLLGNAWKFTARRPHARIEFGTAKEDGCIVHFVRDNGAGFDMAYADKLFGAFQRLHGTTEFPGTGIGLATVQRVIRRHGGRVWARGVVDRGATFYFAI